MLISVLTQKSNARLRGPHFRSNSPLLGVKLQSNAGGMPGAGGGMGGFRIDWYIFSQLLSRVIFCYANTENVFNRLKHLGEL